MTKVTNINVFSLFFFSERDFIPQEIFFIFSVIFFFYVGCYISAGLQMYEQCERKRKKINYNSFLSKGCEERWLENLREKRQMQ